MEFFIIAGIVIIIVLVIVFANGKIESKLLGEQVKEPGNLITENLMILTPTIIPFQNGVSATFMIYENGLMIIQSPNMLEVPWDAITDIQAVNHSHISTQSGSVLGGAAVGGILMGEVGALVGGLAGFQSNTIKGHLLYMSFNYGEYGLTTFALLVGTEVFDFMNLINRYKIQSV